MFEKIVLRRSSTGSAITAGELAEAMLFYSKVHMVLDYPSLSGLVRSIGMSRLLSILARPGISATYCEEQVGTRTQTIDNAEWHCFVAFTFVGDQTVGAIRSRTERFAHMLRGIGASGADAKKLAEGFRAKVKIIRLADDSLLVGGIPRAAQAELLDASFVHEAMRHALAALPRASPVIGPFAFNVIPGEHGFRIETDVNFEPINAARSMTDPEAGSVTPAYLIHSVLTAKADALLAAHYGGEFHTSELSSNIIRLRFGDLLRKFGSDTGVLKQFREVTVPSFPSVADVINGGARTFDEFMALLDASAKFREWCSNLTPDDNLIASYIRDIRATGWANSIPVKAARFVVTTVAGVLDPSAGVAVSVADAFLLDKLLAGWRPNHFIESELKLFLTTEGMD